MKKFKLSLVAVVAALFCVSNVNAQEIQLGVKAGANLSTFGGDLKKTNSVFKYQFGITADIGFTENVYIITGLDFQTKGTKQKLTGEHNVKYNPMYLQLPVHAGYKFDIAPQTRLVVEAGPYIAYGIGGKAKGESKVNVFGDDRLKRFDFGVGAGVGVEFGKIAVKGGYDFGLIDVSDVKGMKIRNNNAYLTLGYRF